MAVYFENTKTGKRFKVLSWNEETGEVVMKGEVGDPFTETFDKKRFKQMNYKPIEVPDEDATTEGDTDDD